MTAAEIGVGASNYTGNANLGGGSFGAVVLDTRPIEDLARYTMLFNKSEYDQRQKDAEKAADEIADMTSYDLTSGIPKDAKILQDKYDRLTSYVRDNPDALDYKNKEAWAEYKKRRNELDNDLRGAKVRNTMWALRQKEIQDEPDQAKKNLMQAELDKEIADTDIRTPIKHSQQYADNKIQLPSAPELTFDVTKTGPNAVVGRTYSYFNVPKARANGNVFALDLDEVDPSTPQGQRDQLGRKNNFWLQGADAFNSVINAKDEATGEFLYKTKVTAPDGTITYSLNEEKLSKLPRNILNLVKQTNEYLTESKAEIESGVLKDKFEKTITFGDGALDPNDYAEINYQDGISPEELALIAQFAAWKGDTYSTKVQQTDNAIQLGAQAVDRRGQDIAANTADKNRKESARQFDAGNTDSGNTPNDNTTGNAFDEIGGTEDIQMDNGGKISNGFVLKKDGSGYTGKVSTPAKNLPASMKAALSASKLLVSEDEKVDLVVKNGQIISVTDASGQPISRQAMENAQKKFDTEQKGQQRTKWGRTNDTPISTPNTETPAQRAKRIAAGG